MGGIFIRHRHNDVVWRGAVSRLIWTERLDRRLMTPTPTSGALLQMIQQNDDKHEDGHARLRGDYRSIEGRVVSLEAARVASDLRLASYIATPIDIGKINFTTPVVIAIAIAAATDF